MLHPPLFYIVENSQIQYPREPVFVVTQIQEKLTQPFAQKTFSGEAEGILK